MLEAYGVWGEKSMYGKTFHGVLRTTVLIGADGRIMKIWRNVKVDGHADEVLAAVRALVIRSSHSLKINHEKVKSLPQVSRTELLSDRRGSADVVPFRSIFRVPPAPSA